MPRTLFEDTYQVLPEVRRGHGCLGKPRCADAPSKEPCGFLGDAKFPRHLRRRNAFAGVGEHEDGQKPLLQRKAAFGQYRAFMDAEMLAAIFASVEHRLMVLALCDAYRAAVTANRFISPPALFKELARGFLIGELPEELKCARASSI